MFDYKNKVVSLSFMIVGLTLFVLTLILDALIGANAFQASLLIISIIVLLFGVYNYPKFNERKVVNIIFLFPLVLAFSVTILIPFITGIFYSLTNWDGIKYSEFVGFKNYIDMFKTPDFLYSLWITIIYSVINIFLVNLVAFGLALICTSSVRGKNIYRAAFFIPNLIGGIVLGYVWQFIFNKVFTSIITDSVSMLTDPNLALLAIIIVSTWQYAGYIMMIFVTGLQGVPKDVMEASYIDGSSYFHSLLKIKIPMIANTFTVCMFLTLVNSFKQFDLNLTITKGAPTRIVDGIAILSTEFLSLNIYKTAILQNKYALGQAKAVIFFIVLAIVSLIQVIHNKRKEIEL